MPKKTEFIYDGFGEEQPVLGTSMSINGFSEVMEAKLIDGRLLTFAVKTKCNDDEACFKYRGVGSFEVVGQGFGMEIDLENVDWKLVKLPADSQRERKAFNDAFIRKYGHYLK